MAKVLLVDTNFSSTPIYKALNELGHEVHVVGANPNDCLARLCKNYWNINYSDTDALGDLIDREGFEFIIPGSTDRSYASCSIVSSTRNFPGIATPEEDQVLNDKEKFRALAQKLQLRVPQVQDSDNKLRWPLIVKPVDSFSGNGVTVLAEKDPNGLEEAIEKARLASAKGRYLIEDFVSGQLHSHAAFFKNGKVINDFIVQENSTINPFAVDTSKVLPNPSTAMIASLRHSVEVLANALNMRDGMMHTQFILNDQGVWLIEITRRSAGDLYSQLIELSTGYPYAQNYIRPFLGMEMAECAAVEYKRIMRHTITVPMTQSYEYISFNEKVTLERFVALSATGDQLKQSPLGRAGIIFIYADSDDSFDRIYDLTLGRKLYKVIG